MGTQYKLTITLDPSTLETLKQGQYKLFLGPMDPENLKDSELPNAHVIGSSVEDEISNLPATTTTTSVNTTWSAPTSSGTTPAYMISYSFILLKTADEIKDALANGSISDPIDANWEDAFEFNTTNSALKKIEKATPWVIERTIGFRNIIKAQPLLFLKGPNPKTATPLFWAPSIWPPGRGRLHTQEEDAVWAWFANSTPENSNGIDTVDFSMATQLKFRPGKGISIAYSDSNPNGWGQQNFTTPEPVP